jgi:hypothetical protein
VEVLDVHADVLEKEDVAPPAEAGGLFAVEEIDEGREVSSDGDPRKLARRGRGQPGLSRVLDFLPGDQGEDLLEVALAQLERSEIDRRDAGGVIDLVEEEGEIRKTDEQGPPLPDDGIVLLVDPSLRLRR